MMFFALEGLDGSGKTTLARLFFEELIKRNQKVVLTREPGGTLFGNSIRDILLGAQERNPIAEYLLFAADRAQHMVMIENLLNKKQVHVITDRFIGSSLVYQGEKGVIPAFMLNVFFGAGGFLPDITFWIDAPPEVAAERLSLRDELDNFETHNIETFVRRREEYQVLAEMYGWVRIDASWTPEQSLAQMIEGIRTSKYSIFAEEVFGG